MHPVELFDLFISAKTKEVSLALEARSYLARNKKKSSLERQSKEAQIEADNYEAKLRNLLSGMHPGGFYILSSK